MSAQDDILQAIGSGFGLPVTDQLVPIAHDMLTVAAENIGESVGDLVGEAGEIVGDVADTIGEFTDMAEGVAQQVNEVIDMASDIVDEAMSFLASIWDGIKSIFAGGPSFLTKLRNKQKVFYFEGGMAHALRTIGRGPELPAMPPAAGPEDWVKECKMAFFAGYYDTMLPVHAAIGTLPRLVRGSDPGMWQEYLNAVGLLQHSLAQGLLNNLTGRGVLEQAQQEYQEHVEKQGRWKLAAALIWDRIVLAKKQAADSGTGSLADEILLSASPGTYAIKAIF